MSPIYEYRCGEGHITETIRRVEDRDDELVCDRCQTAAVRIQSLPAKRTDGIYSYAPNIGSAQKFERHRDAVKRGDRLIDGVPE